MNRARSIVEELLGSLSVSYLKGNIDIYRNPSMSEIKDLRSRNDHVRFVINGFPARCNIFVFDGSLLHDFVIKKFSISSTTPIFFMGDATISSFGGIEVNVGSSFSTITTIGNLYARNEHPNVRKYLIDIATNYKDPESKIHDDISYLSRLGISNVDEIASTAMEIIINEMTPEERWGITSSKDIYVRESRGDLYVVYRNPTPDQISDFLTSRSMEFALSLEDKSIYIGNLIHEALLATVDDYFKTNSTAWGYVSLKGGKLTSFRFSCGISDFFPLLNRDGVVGPEEAKELLETHYVPWLKKLSTIDVDIDDFLEAAIDTAD